MYGDLENVEQLIPQERFGELAVTIDQQVTVRLLFQPRDLRHDVALHDNSVLSGRVLQRR
jgi:hypothetical protein